MFFLTCCGLSPKMLGASRIRLLRAKYGNAGKEWRLPLATAAGPTTVRLNPGDDDGRGGARKPFSAEEYAARSSGSDLTETVGDGNGTVDPPTPMSGVRRKELRFEVYFWFLDIEKSKMWLLSS